MYQSIPKPPMPPPPGHLTGVLFRTVENLTQNEARQVEHLTVVSKRWSASQAKGSRNSFIRHVHRVHESLLLTSAASGSKTQLS